MIEFDISIVEWLVLAYITVVFIIGFCYYLRKERNKAMQEKSTETEPEPWGICNADPRFKQCIKLPIIVHFREVEGEEEIFTLENREGEVQRNN